MSDTQTLVEIIQPMRRSRPTRAWPKSCTRYFWRTNGGENKKEMGRGAGHGNGPAGTNQVDGAVGARTADGSSTGYTGSDTNGHDANGFGANGHGITATSRP